MTASRVIYKYPFSDDVDPTPIPWPGGSRVLHVGCQLRDSDTLPTIWVDHPFPLPIIDGASVPERLFTVMPTGFIYPTGPDGPQEFIGSAVCYAGQFVWHVFAETIEVPF